MADHDNHTSDDARTSPDESDSSTIDEDERVGVAWDMHDEPVPVILNEPQSICAPQMLERLLRYKKVINGSPTGSGKTPTTFWIMQELRRIHGKPIKLVVVGPSALEANKTKTGPSTSPWSREAAKYNEDHIFMTYDSIRGSTPSKRANQVVYDVRGGPTVSDMRDIHECMEHPDEFRWYDSTEQELYGEDIDEIDPDPAQRSYTNYCGLIVRKDVKITTEREKPTTRTATTSTGRGGRGGGTGRGGGRVAPKREAVRHEHTFAPSKWWMQYCSDEDHIVLLVIDEAHFAKNNSVQNNAVAALIRGVTRAAAMRPDGLSYFMFLTSTPMDRETQAANYFKLMGYTDPVMHDDMFIESDVRSVFKCFEEARLYNEKRAIEIGLEKKIISTRSGGRYGESRATITNPAHVTFQLWLECVLSEIQFVIVSMSPRQLWNGFFDIHDRNDRRMFRKAHHTLKMARALAEQGKTDQSMKLMSEGHLLADAGMVGTIARVVIEGLTNHPNRRYIVAFQLIESVERFIQLLKEAGFGPSDVGRVAGINDHSVETDKRKVDAANAQAIHDFQNDNIKVIAGTFAMLSTGLDLHDLHGDRQRFTLFPGIYDITLEQQIAGRSARFGSRSVPQIFICYPKNTGADIQKIYTSNVRKSVVMTKALESIQKGGLSENDMKYYRSVTRLPGAYDRYIELPDGCQDMSYIWDYPMYDRNTDTYFPEEGTYGYIQENDLEGKNSYWDTSYLIKFLEDLCYTRESADPIPGIVFSGMLPGTHDPTLVEGTA